MCVCVVLNHVSLCLNQPHRWADSDIFILNMSIKLEDIIDQWGQDDEVQVIITRDCLTINGKLHCAT